jgi:ABC-2 type transport system ATP-binding protein
MSEATPPPLALEIRGLAKAYRVGHLRPSFKPALHGLDLGVHKGEVFGYLGPNGSGKTTTLKILMGLCTADAGEARILGVPYQERAWRFRTGYLPENPYLYDYLTAREYLVYAGRLFGLPRSVRESRARELLHGVGLDDAADVPLRRFSKGMLQRAGLAQALVSDPELLILDEPMSGLDPLGRRMVRNLILELRRAGKTVLFSTHVLSDAETLCDRVAVLNAGRVVGSGRLDELLRIDVTHMEVLVSGLPAEAVDGLEGVLGREPLGERWALEVEERALGALVQAVTASGGRVLAVQPQRKSLEDYFVEKVEHNAPPAAAEAR